MYKIKKQLNLTNKYFYWSVFILLIMILTAINNLYFYKHVEKSAYRDAKQLDKLLQYQIQFCKEKNFLVEECNKYLISNIKIFADNAYYNNKIEIESSQKEFIWSKIEKESERVTYSEIMIVLADKNDFSDFHFKGVTKFNNLLFISSIFKSMTFSISDFFSVTYNLGMREAINNFKSIYWYRSRPIIGFAIFTYIILWLSRKRTYKLKELQQKEDLEIKEIFQKDLKNNNEIKNTIIIKDKIIKYDFILNPPINTLKFEDLFNDLDTIGTKFRKVAEKIIFKVYEEQIGKKTLKISLSRAVYELHEKEILSDTAKNYISIVRVYGNISSHYSDSTICREEAIAIASSLLNVIDEIYEKNLLK